jgi:hypothetical protein
MQDIFPVRSNIVEGSQQFVRFVGGTTAVTKVAGTGSGITVTYIGTGIVDLTWTENPGTFLGLVATFQATTAADVKGHTVVPGVFDTSTRTVRLNITNASEALHDLAALEWLSVLAIFKKANV